jgi:hypothetical protein
VLPGLHGDEAWMGLKAKEISDDGIMQLTGMNTYTGILQAWLPSVCFDWLGKGVWQLRMSGVLCNIAALMILIFTFRSFDQKRRALLFFMIMGQFVFLIISPRIAWEVNSFTFLLISLLIFAIHNIHLKNNNALSKGSATLYLIVNIIGTYNHIIFSCISISTFIGLLLWSFNQKSLVYKNFIIINLLNTANLLTLYFLMKYYLNGFASVWWLVIVVALCFIFAEVYLTKFLLSIPLKKIKFKNPIMVTNPIAIIFFFSFIYFHGFGFFQVVTSNNIFLHFFSYHTNDVERAIFIVSGSLYILLLSIFLIQDMFISRDSIFAWMLLSYLGLFSIYTTNCSYRYYLSILLLSSIYASIKLDKHKVCFYFFITVSIATISANIILYRIFTRDNQHIRPVKFKLSNGVIETSAHFISDKALIDFLKKSKASKITYLSNRYFLEEPVRFYYEINPWIKSIDSSVIVDYDFDRLGTGFKLYRAPKIR